MATPRFIIIHHSVSPKDVPANIAEASFNRNHKERFKAQTLSSMNWYIGYQYVIYGKGEVRQYRGDMEQGAHCKEQNKNFDSIGICLSGDFDKEDPNPEQIASLKKLMGELIAKYNIPTLNIFPHRKYALNGDGTPYKSCYGKRLSDDWASNLMKVVPVVDTTVLDPEFAKKWAGAMILNVEKRGELWYVNPKDLKRYYLSPSMDIQEFARRFATGFKNNDVLKIEEGK